MSDAPKPVTVQLLGKDYLVSCPEEECEELLASARFLDEKMQQIRGAGKVIGLDRIAVMAALNIAHELLGMRLTHAQSKSALEQGLNRLGDRLAGALERCDPDAH